MRSRRGSAPVRAAPAPIAPPRRAPRAAPASRDCRRSRARDSASGEPLLAERLEQVVDGVDFERAQRVLVVGGGEDHGRRRGRAAPAPRSRLSFGICTSRNIEIRRELRHRLHRVEAVAALGDDLDARDARPGTPAPPRAPAARRPRSRPEGQNRSCRATGGDGVNGRSHIHHHLHGGTEQRRNHFVATPLLNPMSPFLRYSVAPCERPLVSPSPPVSPSAPLSPSAATPLRATHHPVPPRTGARCRRAAHAAARARWRGRSRCPARRGRSGSHGFSTVIDQRRAAARRGDANRAAVEHVRDAVRHRVLDERLQQQRRHQARRPRRRTSISTWRRSAEAHLLDFEEPPGQRQLAGQP